LLQKNPKSRLEELYEIKAHPFFHEIVWEDLKLKKVPSPFKIAMVKKILQGKKKTNF
jgi:hypothetical protein